jgi:calpain-15
MRNDPRARCSSSLCHDWSATEPGANVEGVSELWREIVWRRPADILARDEAGADGRQAHVFDGPVAPDDIRQGELGDCYLLSALSVLAGAPRCVATVCGSIAARQPLRLPAHCLRKHTDAPRATARGRAEAENAVEALFVKGKESDQHGVYVVRLCVQGHWHEIVLDELLPCFSDAEQRGQPIFSRGRGSELWVMLVEKAWAKVHGSYQAIIAGLPGECLTNLTGAPCKFVPFDEPTMWEKVYEATTLDPDVRRGAAAARATPR